jgi:hypothetical protein
VGVVSRTLRRGLRQATAALATAPVTHAAAGGPGCDEPAVPEPLEQDSGDHDRQNERDRGHDEEGAAIAELGLLLEILSDTVGALAGAARSPRRAQLRVLETALRDTSAGATELCQRPSSWVPPHTERPVHTLLVDRGRVE